MTRPLARVASARRRRDTADSTDVPQSRWWIRAAVMTAVMTAACGALVLAPTVVSADISPSRSAAQAFPAAVMTPASSLLGAGAVLTPDAGSTGVPAGTVLRVRNGDLTITKDGTVIDRMDIRGFVYVKANNVTIKRSVIRGRATIKDAALVTAWWNKRGLKITDSTLKASQVSNRVDGISGNYFVATRVDISRVVDSIKVIGSHVRITDSWLHGNYHTTDSRQPDGKTHNDGVQVQGGSRIFIVNNLIEDASNAALMVTQNYAATGTLEVSRNVLRDGACTINVTQKGLGTPIRGMSIASNKFGDGQYGKNCAMRLPSASPVAVSGNTWERSSPTVAARVNRF